jgi:uncharacterized protein YfaS (alpha-2-macroglobulin family)
VRPVQPAPAAPGPDDEAAREEAMQLAVVTDLLPAGFEIAAPVAIGGETELRGLTSSALPLDPVGKTRLVEARDDRWMAIVVPDGEDGDTRGRFRVAYAVRATAPGRFVLPAAAVEDLVRPEVMARTAPDTISVDLRLDR